VLTLVRFVGKPQFTLEGQLVMNIKFAILRCYKNGRKFILLKESIIP
jgi:hypothetical protein